MAVLAYPGRPGAYSEVAATALGLKLGAEVTSAGPTFLDAFTALMTGAVAFAALPLRNSRAGWVVPTLELLSEPEIAPELMGTEVLSIRHALLRAAGEVGVVEEVWSHPQALAQCTRRIQAEGWRTREFENTALAAEAVARERPAHVAAIANERCSRLMALDVQETGIQDDDDNETTFGLFQRRPAGEGARNSTAVLSNSRAGPQLLRLENATCIGAKATLAAANIAPPNVSTIPNAGAVTTFVIVTEPEWAARLLEEAGGQAVGAFVPFAAASSSARS